MLGLLALFAVLAIGGAVIFVLRQSSEPVPTTKRVVAEAPAADTALPIQESAGDRTAVAPSEGEPPPLPVVTVRGRVVDASGTPVPEIEVGVLGADEDSPIVAKSDRSGSFQLAATELPCSIVVVDPRWTTLRAGEVTEDAPLVPALVVAAPAVAVSGIVVDPQGRPLAGARLGIRAVRGEWDVGSAADGTFTFARAPAIAAARLSTRLAEFATDERTLDLPPPERLRIVLVPVPPEGPVLTGTVARADGSSASGATVSFGSARTRTDIEGRFRLVCAWYDAATPLVAAERRSSPAILAGYGAQVECSVVEHPPVRIVLPGVALSITGRVLLPNGGPAKGWRVALADPTPLDPGGVSPDVVEELGEHRVAARTDGSGGFELRGLADRSYTLLAFGRDRSSGIEILVRSDPFPAGSRDVVLGTWDGNAGAAITGRVLSPTGTPVVGAHIGLGRPDPRGSGFEYGMQGRFRTRSDAEGRFEILGVPAGLVSLVITHEGFLASRTSLDPGKPRGDLVVRMRHRREFFFDGSAASPPPDLLRAVSEGKPVSARLFDGRVSDPIAVDEDLREIVLYRGCREIGRVPLALAPEGTTRVVWP